jgi:hypothetical protein
VFSEVPGRVRVAVRLRPRNAEESVADADFADCVELQPEGCLIIQYLDFLFVFLDLFQFLESLL